MARPPGRVNVDAIPDVRKEGHIVARAGTVAEGRHGPIMGTPPARGRRASPARIAGTFPRETDMSSQSPPTGTGPIPAGKLRPVVSRPRKHRWGLLPFLIAIIAGAAGGAWYLNHEGKRTAIASQTAVP